MSKELVARALERLERDIDDLCLHDRHYEDEAERIRIQMALIRAVDEQYPEGYDETGGYTSTDSIGHVYCKECLAGRDYNGHGNNCDRWNTRVALLALCRDITGEKG